MAKPTRNRCKCGFTYTADADKPRRKCPKCGEPRVTKTKSKALKLPYEFYVELEGGDHCGVCGVGPSPRRKLDRDHDHKTDTPRGLLCHRHNRLLSPRMGWAPRTLRGAADYLERGERSVERFEAA